MAIPTPHDVTIIRPGTDAYGNPASGWGSATETEARGFYITRLSGGGRSDMLLFPPDVDVRQGDRVRAASETFYVSAVAPARSPGGVVLLSCGLERVEGT